MATDYQFDMSPQASTRSEASALPIPVSLPSSLPASLNTDSLRQLVHDFYADVIAHELLGPVFQKELGSRWDTHLDRMVDFWSTVMLGTRTFRGNLVQRHMQLQDVSPAHFNAWIQLWTHHTHERFDSNTIYKLRRVAHDIGRQLFTSYFEEQRASHAR